MGAVAAAVEELARPGDGLLFTPMRRRLWTLTRSDAFRGTIDLSLERSPRASHTLYGTEATPEVIRQRILEHRGRIIVVQDRKDAPLDQVPGGEEIKRTLLNEEFTACAETVIGPARIGVYIRGRRCPAPLPSPEE